ncbi:MAG: nucleoside phosphorylase [Thermoplasmatales archaeon]|nr:nucleoside phosphorylase [Thermoplasmatales archaeon]
MVKKQYHIGVAPGEISDYILLCGDPTRVERTAKLFDKTVFEGRNREYLTFTGTYKKMPVSVMSTGIGPDNTEIAVIEISQIVKKPVFIRIGSSGALQKNIKTGELVISTGSVRLENTSLFFVTEGYPAVADYSVVESLVQAAEKLGYPYHVGLTATAPGFYGAQCRKTGFPLRVPNLIEHLRKCNVLNFEMESSTLFILSSIKGFKAGTVCAVYANRPKNIFISEKEKHNAELRCIKTGLEAMRILYEKDNDRKTA